ncbi:MAG: glycosyltransferase family 2 protein, partial [Desulfovibrionaceae bacterium]|nr:glycosyltransferase family 2 protein [Desulfovibrionaceae bacterium]
MPPTLSIIITNYNYTDKLPGLFANIMAQTISDYEVVLVDDCSDTSPDAVVDEWRNKGLPIVLSKNKTRQYTKDSRLNGIEVSRGELITFIDADDLFYKTRVLEYHVNMAQELGVEILHFSALHYENGKISKNPFIWTQPIGEHLTGKDIFKKYVVNRLNGHTVWGKIVTRDLWLRCMEPARASAVRRYCEDLALCSFLFFHAKSYYGSNRLGYEREWVDRVAQKSFGRYMTYYTQMTEFITYVRANGADVLTGNA